MFELWSELFNNCKYLLQFICGVKMAIFFIYSLTQYVVETKNALQSLSSHTMQGTARPWLSLCMIPNASEDKALAQSVYPCEYYTQNMGSPPSAKHPAARISCLFLSRFGGDLVLFTPCYCLRFDMRKQRIIRFTNKHSRRVEKNFFAFTAGIVYKSSNVQVL